MSQGGQRATFAVTGDEYFALGRIERFHGGYDRCNDRLNIVTKFRVDFAGKIAARCGYSEEIPNQSGMESGSPGGIVPRNATMIPFAFFPTRQALMRSEPVPSMTVGAGTKSTTPLNGCTGVQAPVTGSIP
jgi:hypothetical protein